MPWQEQALSPLSGLCDSLAEHVSSSDLEETLRSAEDFLESLGVLAAGASRET